MKTAVLKTDREFPHFNEVLQAFTTNGFEDIEIIEAYGLKEEEAVDKYVELQGEYDFVLPIPPLPPNVTNKIMHELMKKEEV